MHYHLNVRPLIGVSLGDFVLLSFDVISCNLLHAADVGPDITVAGTKETLVHLMCELKILFLFHELMPNRLHLPSNGKVLQNATQPEQLDICKSEVASLGFEALGLWTQDDPSDGVF